MSKEIEPSRTTRTPNLRELLGITDEYVGYCREERNFAAVLYHLLLDTNRLRSFLALIGQLEVAGRPPVNIDDVRIYFEYAHLRDLWAEVADKERKKDQSAEQALRVTNDRYRETIVSMLCMPVDLQLQLPSITAFNAFFTGPRVRAASSRQIQMPSRWSDSQFDNWSKVGGDTFAKRACSLKWAFNAKPDLVLHLGADKAVCIEAKLESGAGAYQVKSDPNPEGCFGMGQFELQEFILNDLLGYKTDFIIISKASNWQEGNSTRNWRSYSWQETYAELLKDKPSVDGESKMVAAFASRSSSR